jgi:hypothetical protein
MSASARRVPHAVSGSSTALRISRTGGRWPRHLGRREHMSDTVQAIAGLLSHQRTTDLTSAQQM